jgi:hypothetical protein
MMEVVAALQRPARSTRGKRLSKLVDEEVEADEEFWNQDAFKEVHHFPALFAALVFSIYPIPGYHCCSDRGLGSQIQLNVADVLIRQ